MRIKRAKTSQTSLHPRYIRVTNEDDWGGKHKVAFTSK